MNKITVQTSGFDIFRRILKLLGTHAPLIQYGCCTKSDLLTRVMINDMIKFLNIMVLLKLIFYV